ncbi:MAG: 30S ribosomal protein S6 [Deferribacterota bacterium]|nr:30S ribosomal protein S6 [Deferribacterota bacterium]
MRVYETILITRANLTDDASESIYNEVKDYLEKNDCQILKEEKWGRKKLAYDIDKQNDGIYYYIKYISSKYSIPKELERRLNLNENILRFLTTRLNERKENLNIDKSDNQKEETTNIKEE